jgi:hypothetical protein
MNERRESLGNRLVSEANRCREEASRLPPAKERDELLKRAQQVDAVADLNDCLNSPGSTQP